MAPPIHRSRAILSLTSTLYVTYLLVTSRTARAALVHLFSPTVHPLRFITLLTTLFLNLKSLPLVWHFRLFGVMFYQLYHTRPPLPQDALFRPMITRSCHTTLPESDYNMHKSNSTYFADFDIARTMLVTCLMRKGIREASRYRNAGSGTAEDAGAGAGDGTGTAGKDKPRSRSMSEKIRAGFMAAAEVASAETTMRTPGDTDERPPRPSAAASTSMSASIPPPPSAGPDSSTSGALPSSEPKPDPKARFLIALGGVSTTFHKEIKPYEAFDIWTRVLSWDRKWIYFVSHMVKAGSGAPDDCALQPGKARRGGGKQRTAKKSRGIGALEALERERQPEWRRNVFASSIAKYVVKKGRLTISPELVWRRSDLFPADVGGGGLDAVGGEEAEGGAYAWTQANVERERKRGWDVLAGHFAELDKAGAEWPVVWGDDVEAADGDGGIEGEGEGVAGQGATGRKKVNVLGAFADWFVL